LGQKHILGKHGAGVIKQSHLIHCRTSLSIFIPAARFCFGKEMKEQVAFFVHLPEFGVDVANGNLVTGWSIVMKL